MVEMFIYGMINGFLKLIITGRWCKSDGPCDPDTKHLRTSLIDEIFEQEEANATKRILASSCNKLIDWYGKALQMVNSQSKVSTICKLNWLINWRDNHLAVQWKVKFDQLFGKWRSRMQLKYFVENL